MLECRTHSGVYSVGFTGLNFESACPLALFTSGITCKRHPSTPLRRQFMAILIQRSFYPSVPSFLAICRWSCTTFTSDVIYG